MSISITSNNSIIVGGNICGSFGDGVQGNGDYTEEARVASDFKKIVLSGAVDVEFTVSYQPSLKVIADSNLHELISTTVSGDVLQITSTGSYSTNNKIKVICSSASLKRISLQGSGDADIDGIDSKQFRVDIQGSGDCYVSGKSTTLTANIHGSGDIDCRDLKAKTAELSIFGSGDIHANCSKELSATIAGSGDIRVKGSPDHVSKHVTGSGSIKVK